MESKFSGLKGRGIDTNGVNEYEKQEFQKYISNGDVKWLTEYGSKQNFDILWSDGKLDSKKLNTLFNENQIDASSNATFYAESGLAKVKEIDDAKTKFTTELWSPTTEAQMKEKLQTDAAKKLLEANPGYTQEVSVTGVDGKKANYIIRKDPNSTWFIYDPKIETK